METPPAGGSLASLMLNSREALDMDQGMPDRMRLSAAGRGQFAGLA